MTAPAANNSNPKKIPKGDSTLQDSSRPSFLPILKKAVIFLLFVYILLFFFRPLELGDSFWHLKTGQWIWQQQQVPRIDPFPFQNQGQPWTFTQWLGSTIFYLVFLAGQEHGLILFRAIVFALTAGLFFSSARRLPMVWAIILTLFLAYGLNNRCLLRPFIFNFIFIQILLVSLIDFEKTGEIKKLLAIPLCGILWSNLHLGSFVYGLTLLSVFFFSAGVQYVNNRMKRDQSSASNALNNFKLLFLATLCYLTCFVFSPYGGKAALYPFQVFIQPTFIHFYALNDIITEMRPPTYLLTSCDASWFLFLVIAGAITLFLNKKRTLSLTLLFIFSLFAFLFSKRGSGFFTLVSLYVIIDNLGDLRFKLFWQDWPRRRIAETLLFPALACILLFGIFKSFALNTILDRQLKRQKTLTYNLPALSAAIAFLEQHNFSGPIFCNDTLGGFLLWRSYPHLRPFVDGRQLNQDNYTRFLLVLNQPQQYWKSLERDFGFQSVMLDMRSKSYEELLATIHESAQWQLVFLKGPIVIFAHHNASFLTPALKSVEQELAAAQIPTTFQQEVEHLPPVHPWLTVLDLFFPPAKDIDFVWESDLLYKMGYQSAGVRKVANALISEKPFLRKAAIRFIQE